MPSLVKTLISVERPDRGGADEGVTIRKSSRRWRTKGSLWLLVGIQQSSIQCFCERVEDLRAASASER